MSTNEKLYAVFGLGAERIIQIDARQSVTAARLRVMLASVRVTETCWLFEGYRPCGLHGRIEFREQQIYVHRAAFACVHGPIPDGINICHACDVPNCIRPEHLFPGTQVQNIADMDAKGRGRRAGWRRGSHHHHATLTDAEVADLRAVAAVPGAKQRDVAAAFGVSQSTVWRLLHRKVRAA